MKCTICNNSSTGAYCISCKESALALAEKLLKAQAKGRTGFITTDKLFLVNRCIKEARKELSDTEMRNKLHHWDELMNALISSGGNKVIEQLDARLSKHRNSSEPYLEKGLEMKIAGQRLVMKPTLILFNEQNDTKEE